VQAALDRADRRFELTAHLLQAAAARVVRPVWLVAAASNSSALLM
jgi:hypothetical protein